MLYRKNIDISGTVLTPLHIYSRGVRRSQKDLSGLFSINVSACFAGQIKENLIMPIHIWSSELVHYFKNHLKKEQLISVHGVLCFFKGRLLMGVKAKDDIRFLSSTKDIVAQNDNLSHAQLVWACNEEDMFMARLAASEAADSSAGRGWLCEK